MITYAQNFEDVMLARAFKGRERGFYVDVGAGDPNYMSVTRWFYDQGWSGINLEPNRTFFKKLVTSRPRDITLNIGASDSKGVLAFEETSVPELSTFVDNSDASRRGACCRTDVAPLNEVLTTHAVGRQIDFLKIDVEGWELQVLKGLDLNRFRPAIMVIEAVLPESTTPSHHEWEPLVTESNYSMVYFDGLNRFYLAEERRELAQAFELPPGVFDEITHHQVVSLSYRLRILTDSIRNVVQICGLPSLSADASIDELAQAMSTIGEAQAHSRYHYIPPRRSWPRRSMHAVRDFLRIVRRRSGLS